MTKSEAEAEAKKLKKKGPDWFCPAINGPCNPECINFEKSFVIAPGDSPVVDAKSTKFEVGGHYCTNAQFSGAPSHIICPSCGARLVSSKQTL